MEQSFDKTKIDSIKSWLKTGSINIFGLPLSGKDTAGKTLAEILDAVFISGGDIVRANLDEEVLNQTINKGLLAPTDSYRTMISSYLHNPELDKKPLILSSVGRWSGEERDIINVTNETGHPQKAVLYFKISESAIKERLQIAKETHDRNPNRQDDNLEALEVRFKEFKEKTVPVVEAYRNIGILIEINGDQPRPDIVSEIIDKLYVLAPKA